MRWRRARCRHPWPVTVRKNQVLVLDPDTPGALYTALNTAGVLRAYVPGQDDRGGSGLAN